MRVSADVSDFSSLERAAVSALRAPAAAMAGSVVARTGASVVSSANGRVISALKTFSQIASALVVFAGWLILAAWVFDTVLPMGWMVQGDLLKQGNTALAFILAGLALGLLQARFNGDAESSRRAVVVQRRIGLACACAVAVIGLLALAEYVLGWNLRFTDLFFQRHVTGRGAPASSRMAPNTALNFLLIGSSLLFSTVRIRPAQVLAVMASSLALLALLLAAYAHQAGLSFGSCLDMTMVTALLFVVLCAGLLCGNIDTGLTEILTRRSAGGTLARRLLPASFAVPVVLGALVIQAQRTGSLNLELALVLFTIANVVLFSGLLSLSARTSDRLDEQRRRAEEAMQQAERKFRSIFEHALEGIFQMSLEGRFLTVNTAMAGILGYDSPEELLEHSAEASERFFENPSRREEFNRQMREKGSLSAFEFEALRKDNQKIWLLGNIRVVETDSGPAFYEGSAVDITERKGMQERFRQAQKMEVVGRLAGGVAHDFNNILTVILGSSEMALDDLSINGRTRAVIADIRSSSMRAAGLTRQLLAFSRKQDLYPRLLDLNLVVTDFQKMLFRIIGEDLRLVIKLQPGLGRIKADPGQLEQIIMNLAVNARDAMPQGGVLTIETSNVRLDHDHHTHSGEIEAGSYVMLSLRDTGCGMSNETKSHLFEPFFTTKDQGKGTGLGLATVYGIVKQTGGCIDVESEPRKGTAFKIYFPRVEASEERLLKGGKASTETPRGWEHILLAEDEPGVRDMTRAILEAQGYRVTEAANGEEALRICAAQNGAFHLMLTDVIMPGMRGPELAQHVLERWPSIKVLYMSGYTGEPVATIRPLLHKPFNRIGLAQALREVLDSPGSEHEVELTQYAA